MPFLVLHRSSCGGLKLLDLFFVCLVLCVYPPCQANCFFVSVPGLLLRIGGCI